MCILFTGIASFSPKAKGNYSVDVTQGGKNYSGSPFSIDVGDGQVCNAAKVKVSGAMKDAMAGKFNDINVDASTAGKAILYFH